MKRIFDIILSGILLTILGPIFALVSICILINMGRPILFVQERSGKNLVKFKLIKFRTMIVGEELDRFRITSLGKFLRKTSLDEIPQLINVLRGDISLVGPRPMPIYYLKYFKREEMARFNVPQGITGWAQINGRNLSRWDDRFSMDVWYVQNWSFWLDFKILLLTIAVVFTSKGTVADARSIMLNLDEERGINKQSDTIHE